MAFCICVAGKNAKTTAKAINKLVELSAEGDVVSEFLYFNPQQAQDWLKSVGIGCQRKNAAALHTIAHRIFMRSAFLAEASFDDLMAIPGIGPKTAAYFLMHTRENPTVAVLDRHILRWMGEPDQTPSNMKRYMELSDRFLREASIRGMHPADLDLRVWKEMRTR